MYQQVRRATYLEACCGCDVDVACGAGCEKGKAGLLVDWFCAGWKLKPKEGLAILTVRERDTYKSAHDENAKPEVVIVC